MLTDFLAFTLAHNGLAHAGLAHEGLAHADPADTGPPQSHGELPGGATWRWLGAGVLECLPAAPAAASVVLSAGIHGDETAPIEILSALVAAIAVGEVPLRVRLLILLGNVAAMCAARRYLDDDLNRLFGGRHRVLPESREALRAMMLEQAVSEFFAGAGESRLHLDLHTAIRPSVFERFALLPQRDAPYEPDIFAWLGALGIEAVLLHRSASGTFAHYSSSEHHALACTLELGKVMPFGRNDLSRYAALADGLRRRLAAEPQAVAAVPPPRIFEVVASLDKRSAEFVLPVGDGMPNFTAYPRGTLVAQDGDYRYQVTHDEERIVFPNPRVKVGLRAGLMVVERKAPE